MSDAYQEYKKQFKKPIRQIAELMPRDFTDDDFINKFKYVYPHLWNDIEWKYLQYNKYSKFLRKNKRRVRYEFKTPYELIKEQSYLFLRSYRKTSKRIILSNEEILALEKAYRENSLIKLKKWKEELGQAVLLKQEIKPSYVNAFIKKYWSLDKCELHKKLEIIRELSKYLCDTVIIFFYSVNAAERNFSFHEEAMRYLQPLKMFFDLRGKKKGKKNFIDNEYVQNDSNPEELMKRLFSDDLEKIKRYDVFISHNSHDEDIIIKLYKSINTANAVCYVDWVNDKYDLRREWCNATTAQVIKKRIQQSRYFVLVLTDSTLNSQWCPWELGYADALEKEIYIIKQTQKELPKYYECYHITSIEHFLSIIKSKTI